MRAAGAQLPLHPLRLLVRGTLAFALTHSLTLSLSLSLYLRRNPPPLHLNIHAISYSVQGIAQDMRQHSDELVTEHMQMLAAGVSELHACVTAQIDAFEPQRSRIVDVEVCACSPPLT